VPDLDPTPANRYLETLPQNKQLSMDQLTSKLGWLLAVVGIFSEDDVACIDPSHEKLLIAAEMAIRPIALPKEKRRLGRIRTFIATQTHANSVLRLVATM
ncbi:hypothetical protein BGZ99_010311, partial [Dissophora globulifera]